ncbi:MAG: hypothetical protein N2036_15745 [Bryobacteraceae bacterium]|nr:hypothetical protein [Bryobacteraceae bacterium]
MATRQTTKKAVRKRPQPGKATRETAARTAKRAAEKAPELKDAGEAKPAKRRTAKKLDRKKLGEMVDKMLLQLAERVEEGECTITTSEGMKLIQLREALGLEQPSAVKVEWVEPKGE